MREEIDAFLRFVQGRRRSPNTLASYRYLLDLMEASMRRRGCLRLADVTAADLDALMREEAEGGRAKSTRVQLAIIVRRFFDWLQQEGRTAGNPARSLPMPDDGEADLPQAPLSEAEVAAIFDGLPRATVFDLRNRCLLEVLYGCGLRISEACGLDVGDIDTARGTLLVREGKGGKDALMPLLDTTLAAVRDWLALRRTMLKGPDHGALLLNQYGRRFDRAAAYNWFNDLNAARGPDARHLHPHLFRHSIAVHLLRGGADIRHVQEFLRHSDLDTTKIYLALVPGRLAEAYHKAMPEVEVGLERDRG